MTLVAVTAVAVVIVVVARVGWSQRAVTAAASGCRPACIHSGGGPHRARRRQGPAPRLARLQPDAPAGTWVLLPTIVTVVAASTPCPAVQRFNPGPDATSPPVCVGRSDYGVGKLRRGSGGLKVVVRNATHSTTDTTTNPEAPCLTVCLSPAAVDRGTLG